MPGGLHVRMMKWCGTFAYTYVYEMAEVEFFVWGKPLFLCLSDKFRCSFLPCRLFHDHVCQNDGNRSGAACFCSLFSNEVTTLTKRGDWTLEKLSEHVDSLNEEYIRFINRMYFNELTSQDQGVELYGLIRQNLDIDSYVEELKDEIENCTIPYLSRLSVRKVKSCLA